MRPCGRRRRLERDRPVPRRTPPDVPAATRRRAGTATSAGATRRRGRVRSRAGGARAAAASSLDARPTCRRVSSTRLGAPLPRLARSIGGRCQPVQGPAPVRRGRRRHLLRSRRRHRAAELDARRPARLVTVVGPSGSGKSSLVRAGLVPRLRSGGATSSSVSCRAPNPTVALATRRSSRSPTRPPRPRLPWTACGRVARRVGPLVIVVVDQFEELWTLADEDDRVEFVGALVSAIGDERLDVSVITTIRADRFDLPLQDPTIGPEIGAGTYAIGPMSAGQVAEAILGPARRAGVDVDETVVADLVTAAVEPGTLPMLQFTLAELYESRRDGCIGREALDAIGGMAGVIGRTAERGLRRLGAGRAARRPRLAVSSRGTRRRRRRYSSTGHVLRAVAGCAHRHRRLRRRPHAHGRS